EFKPTVTFVTVSGEKRNIQELKNLLKWRCRDNSYGIPINNPIPLITLSDTDSETQEHCETPKKKKHKFLSSECSPSMAVKKQPLRKRTRYEQSSPSKKYIPLCVAKDIKETPTVKINCKNKYVVNATNEEKSSFATENVVPWPSWQKVITSYRTNFPASCKTDATCTLDDSVKTMPSFPKKKDITVLDDSIIEIIDLEGQNQQTSQSKNGTAQLNKLCTKPLNCLKHTKMNKSQKRASVFNKRDNIAQSNRRRTVLLPKWTNASQKLVTGRNLKNVVRGSNFLMPAGLALQFLKNVTNLSSAIRNSSQKQASTFNKRNNIVKLSSSTVHLPEWNKNLECIDTKHKLTNGGLQNVTTRPYFSMPGDLALQLPGARLRPIVIDGTNIARAHGSTKRTYSCKGIKISVDFFLRRGHTEVTAFIPKYRKHQLYGKIPTTNANFLEDLEKTGHIAYAPSRKVDGKTLSCYNDRFVVQLATQTGGIIVSNSNFKDIVLESEAFKKTVTERLLMFCFVGDKIVFPDGPLGKNGPRLKEFLAFPPEHSHIL
ncbi:hypothetical protein JTE90_000348, partial [Oedothorax gibbosus]